MYITLIGPTETTVCSTYHKCNKCESVNIPIGKTIANYKNYIMSEDNQLLPKGCIGELCIGGAGLSSGYINNKKLTEEKFVFNKSINEMVYKTGDLCRLNNNNEIEFCGRKDKQLKIRGYRVSLIEIEKMSKTIAGVRNQIKSTADTEKERFSFVELIEGIEILFGSLLRKNNCQLIYDKSKDYYLYGEKNKLDRVIGNVIKNSIDAYIEKEKKGKIEVSISKNDKEYIIKIADEAGGIPNEIKDTLFKEMRTTKGENGTGFGLYYSNTIIESSFKGTITFETKENVGTTFYINLPLKYNNKEEN